MSRRQSKLDLFLLFFSCIIHDYKHPGLNSQYLVATKHDIALNYSDKQTLERFHVAEVFKLLASDETFADLLDCLDAASAAEGAAAKKEAEEKKRRKESGAREKGDSDIGGDETERDSTSSLNTRLPVGLLLGLGG